MKIVNDNGPWKGIKPRGRNPIGIVVHAMGQFIAGRYASEWMKDHYSPHAFIDPNGTIILAAPTTCKSWHAGLSRHNNLVNLNKHYLGVELLVKGDFNGIDELNEAMKDPECYTPAQYDALADICKLWMKEYPEITKDTIVGHCRVSGDDVRGKGKGKQDPGTGFDWRLFRKLME